MDTLTTRSSSLDTLRKDSQDQVPVRISSLREISRNGWISLWYRVAATVSRRPSYWDKWMSGGSLSHQSFSSAGDCPKNSRPVKKRSSGRKLKVPTAWSKSQYFL